jgi:hypothetical protein
MSGVPPAICMSAGETQVGAAVYCAAAVVVQARPHPGRRMAASSRYVGPTTFRLAAQVEPGAWRELSAA